MANLRYALKEVANVTFYDLTTGKPALFFDTLKVSTIETKSESAEATGGQGSNKIVGWEFGRSATLQMKDALLSDVSLGILAGNTVDTSGIDINKREVVTATANASAIEVMLTETPKNVSSITVFKMDSKGLMDTEVTGFTQGGVGNEKKLTFPTGVAKDDKLIVFYVYTKATGATRVTFAGNKFPATYRVVGDFVGRTEDGVDRQMQFVIPKAKMKSDFSLTLDATNVATFDFNLDVLLDTTTQKLYDIIRIN